MEKETESPVEGKEGENTTVAATVTTAHGTGERKGCQGKNIFELISISIATLFLSLHTIIATLSTIPTSPYQFGFRNATYDAQPSGQYSSTFWVFPVVMLILFTSQVLWITYGWTYTCRPHAIRTIHWSSYVIFCIGSFLAVCWLYSWGNGYDKSSYPILLVYGATVYVLVISHAGYFYKKTPRIDNKIDLWLTRIFVTNGLLIYTTWITGANLLAVCGLIYRHKGVSGENTAILLLSVVTVGYCVYFILDNTILNRFLRYSFCTYPVVILFVYGVMQRNCWESGDLQENRTLSTCIFSSVLLGVAIVIFIIRLILIGVFARYRRLVIPDETSQNYEVFDTQENLPESPF